MLVALIPAHNERFNLAFALRALESQTVPPDRIIVIADNCTDTTVEIARSNGVEVVETVGNTHKKAGALNQVLEVLLPTLGSDDRVLVMDADTYLSEGFIENASGYIDRGYSAVGGVFQGRSGGGFVGWNQRNEFARYGYDVKKLKGKAIVLTGTSTIFTVAALRDVVIHQKTGYVYDTSALTEDAQISLLLKHLGHRIIAPVECATTTEVMETWRDLYKQRLRWRRGFVENLIDFGLTKVTLEYWARTVFAMLGIFVTFLYLMSLSLAVIVYEGLLLNPWYLALTAVFILERTVTVKSRGWLAMLLSSVIVVEFVYEVFLQAVYGWAYFKGFLSRTEGSW